MLSWLQISSLKEPLEPSPLLGHCSGFDQNIFTRNMQDSLGINLEHVDSEWNLLEQENARSKLAADTLRYTFLADPLKGLFEIFIPRLQLQNVIGHYFGAAGALTQSLEQSFLDFFIAQFISSLCKAPPLDFIKPTLANRTVQISSQKLVEGVLVFKFDAFDLNAWIWIDETLHNQWLLHWEKQPSLQINKDVAKAVELTMHLQLGRLELTAKELYELQVGDWICLDSMSISEDLTQAQVDLMLEKRKFARAQLSFNQAKIITRDDFFDRLAYK